MRMTLLAAMIAAGSLSTAQAASPALGQSCIAAGQGYSQVVATVAAPEDCCRGQLRCAQFLSTTRVVKPAHDQRT